MLHEYRSIINTFSLNMLCSIFPHQVTAAAIICSGLRLSQIWLEGAPSICLCLCPELPLTLYLTLLCAFLAIPQEKHASFGSSGLFYWCLYLETRIWALNVHPWFWMSLFPVPFSRQNHDTQVHASLHSSACAHTHTYIHIYFYLLLYTENHEFTWCIFNPMP